MILVQRPFPNGGVDDSSPCVATGLDLREVHFEWPAAVLGLISKSPATEEAAGRIDFLTARRRLAGFRWRARRLGRVPLERRSIAIVEHAVVRRETGVRRIVEAVIRPEIPGVRHVVEAVVGAEVSGVRLVVETAVVVRIP